MDSIYFYDLERLSFKYRYIAISSSLRGINMLTLSKEKSFDSKKYIFEESRLIKSAYNELREYIFGERRTFEVELDIIGTSFQKTVWQALINSEYGKVITYSELAERACFPKRFARAIGSAVKQNPIAIIIPCHRVVGASDIKSRRVGNYFFGSDVKRELLAIEGVSIE